MVFGISSRKKQPSLEDLIKEHGRLVGERERLDGLVDETRRRAVLNGMTIEEAQSALQKIEFEASLTLTAQEETRKRLIELVDQQMRTTVSELGTRKAELHQEMAEEAHRAGVLIGSAMNVLRSLGLAFADGLAADLSGAVESAILNYAGKGRIVVDFSKGLSEAPMAETDYRQEQRDLRPPFNSAAPGDPSWSHGIEQAVARLLGEGY